MENYTSSPKENYEIVVRAMIELQKEIENIENDIDNEKLNAILRTYEKLGKHLEVLAQTIKISKIILKSK